MTKKKNEPVRTGPNCECSVEYVLLRRAHDLLSKWFHSRTVATLDKLGHAPSIDEMRELRDAIDAEQVMCICTSAEDAAWEAQQEQERAQLRELAAKHPDVVRQLKVSERIRRGPKSARRAS